MRNTRANTTTTAAAEMISFLWLMTCLDNVHYSNIRTFQIMRLRFFVRMCSLLQPSFMEELRVRVVGGKIQQAVERYCASQGWSARLEGYRKGTASALNSVVGKIASHRISTPLASVTEIIAG